ncbi:hypothetical protein QUF56_14850 [Ureibacillus composti]|nr:hypothetical protein [Ureibacillus composti]HWJ79457.1 hypothetical protein [Niallia sp.]
MNQKQKRNKSGNTPITYKNTGTAVLFPLGLNLFMGFIFSVIASEASELPLFPFILVLIAILLFEYGLSIYWWKTRREQYEILNNYVFLLTLSSFGCFPLLGFTLDKNIVVFLIEILLYVTITLYFIWKPNLKLAIGIVMGIAGVIVGSVVLVYIMGLRPFVSLGTLTEDNIIVEGVKTFPLVFIFMYLLGIMLSILSQEVLKTIRGSKD